MDKLRPVLALSTLLLCGSPALRAQTPPVKPAEPNSFAEVAAQLDSGGSAFFYFSAESLLKDLSEKLAAVRDTPGEAPKEHQETWRRYFSFIVDGLRASGLEELTGLGGSAFEVAPGVTRQKFFLHHGRAGGGGFLWSLFGAAPHKLDALNLLPAKTVFASFSDLDPAQFATLIHQAIGRLGQPNLELTYQQMLAQISATSGLPAEETFRALTGSAGVVLTLDPETKVAMPVSGKSISMPRPSLALVFPAKDDRIYQQLAKMVEANPGTIRTDEGELHMRTATEMVVAPEIKLRPAVARWKEWLIVATDETLIREIIAAQTDGKGFTSSPAFTKLSAGLPAEGNGFQLATELFARTLRDVQLQANQIQTEGQPPSPIASLQKYLTTDFRQSSYAVASHLPTGWLSVGNTVSSGPPHPFGTMLGHILGAVLQMIPADSE